MYCTVGTVGWHFEWQNEKGALVRNGPDGFRGSARKVTITLGTVDESAIVVLRQVSESFVNNQTSKFWNYCILYKDSL